MAQAERARAASAARRARGTRPHSFRANARKNMVESEAAGRAGEVAGGLKAGTRAVTAEKGTRRGVGGIEIWMNQLVNAGALDKMSA